MNSLGSLSINPAFSQEIKNEKEGKKNRLRSSSSVQLKIHPTSISDFIHHNPPKNTTLNGLLSPRDLVSIQNEISKPVGLSPRQSDQLEKIKLLMNTSYDFPTLEEMDKAMEAYYLQLLREVDEKSKSKIHYHFLQIQEKICDSQTPLVSLVKLHFDEFLPLLKIYPDSFSQLKSLLSEIMFTPPANQFSELSMAPPNNYLQNLTFLFKKHSNTQMGAALSFVIFGKNENQLAKLVSLMKKWGQIDQANFLLDLKKLKKFKVCTYWPPINHSFDVEQTKRFFVTDKILPDKIAIDYMPLKLTGFSKDPKILQEEFYRFFLKNICQSWKGDSISEIQFEQIVTSLCKNNFLPDDLRNVVGMSTFSTVWLALECFHEKFPALHAKPELESELIFTSRLKKRDDNARTEIFYNFKSPNPKSERPVNIIIYRLPNKEERKAEKEALKDFQKQIDPTKTICENTIDIPKWTITNQFAIAEIFATLTCELAEQKVNAQETKLAHKGKLEIRHCHFITRTSQITKVGMEKEETKVNATPKQITAILEILGLSPELTNLCELTHLKTNLCELTHLKTKRKLSDQLNKVKSIGKNISKGVEKIKTGPSEEITSVYNPLRNLQKKRSNEGKNE